MAVILSIESSRENIYRCDPYSIVMKEDERGRHNIPDEAVVRMAVSFASVGQIQAVECRKVDGVPHLISGYTRVAAARLLRDGFTAPDGQEHHNPDFVVKFSIVDSNKEGGFERNVIENAHRNATSPLDDARNMAKLRDQNGRTEAQIAALYGCDTAKVARLRRLLELDNGLQELVHTGHMSVDAAITLLSAPAEAQAAIVAASTHDGAIKTSEVRAQVRQVQARHLRDEGTPNGTTAPKPKKISRTFGEFKAWLADVSIRPVSERKEIAVFLETLTEFLDGTATEQALNKSVEGLA